MNNNSPEIDLVLITRYLNGEADVREIGQVNEWRALSSNHEAEFERLQKAWELASAGIGMPEWDLKRTKEQFLWKIIQAQSKAIRNREKTPVRGKRFVGGVMKYAALAILLVGIASLMFHYLPDYKRNKDFTEISVLRGSKTQMTLVDGSKLWLNAGSTIKYNNDYNRQSRDIFLEGEAYFEVAKNHSKPFNVFAGGIVVHAFGTIFNVKAYPEEKVIETTLVEGSVGFEVSNKPEELIMLKPNEQVFYNKSDLPNSDTEKILISKGINTELFTSWINDKLVISSEDLESLAIKLGRKYDVKFHFNDDSLKKLRFTGVLKNETIEQILEVLKISSPVNYRIKERDIWLTTKNKQRY